MDQFSTWIALVILFCLLGLLFVVGYFLVNGVCTVPWVRTPTRYSRRMLELGGFQSGQTVVDLGSGDGAIVFEAVKMGGSGIGLERLRLLVWYSRILARIKNASHKASFSLSDVLKDPLPPADLITCYLFPKVNRKLEPRLKASFPPGTRVVSRDFSFPTLKLIHVEHVHSAKIQVYEI